MRRILWGVLAVAALIVVGGWAAATMLIVRPATYQPAAAVAPVDLRPWPEHDAIYRQTEFPYVLRLDHLLYIGARHTSDAASPQLAEIERLWAEFRPTVALCEGRASMFRYARRPTTGTLHESELVRILAHRDGVPLYTLEPEYEAEVRGLLARYEPKLVATYLTLRVFTSEAKGYGGDKDALALHLLKKRTDAEGLRGSLASVADLDGFWRERFPDAPDWRTLQDTEGVPLLVQVGDLSREVRGAHMVASLGDLVGRGEKVLAVVGASHVIRQEPALRRSIGP
jgi:hypothetical protein